MSISFTFGHSQKEKTVISLKRMIKRQLYWFQPIAVKRKSFIINDVPADFYVSADRDLLAKGVCNLLESVIRHASHSCIRVTVKRYSDTILLRVTGGGSIHVQELELNLQKIKPVAERLGGCVMTNDFRKKLAVTFSFRCLSNAA